MLSLEQKIQEILTANKPISVFDFDGTIIKSNSFKKINKAFVLYLCNHRKFAKVLCILFLYFMRKLCLITHIGFKTKLSFYYKKWLAPDIQRKLIQDLYDKELNNSVFDVMKKSEICIVSSAAPYCYLSMLDFGTNIDILITSLHPSDVFPDKSNYNVGKFNNIKQLLGNHKYIDFFYTDNLKEDWPLAEQANNTFLVEGENIKKTKEYIKSFNLNDYPKINVLQ